ncbi:hypothetical protein IDM40_03330 [Nocardiopsis sp. HNM0947]|uniref:WD40 repeat domain-containing protein n=1 Tax=Nocardiopsis coralli TaxID=2772213 RepID=A0ABR9P1N2_9ACTN|nr:hypothetical protein [Nocardiopsis coralli]MBE2997744.1 hypothetical protein [Nocardiopsis coralli]
MPFLPRRAGLLSLAVCASLALASCTGDAGEDDEREAGTGDGQDPDVWGDTPGVVVHSDDRRMLHVLDPETGEEIDSLDPGFGDDPPDYGFGASGEPFTTAFSPDFRHMARVTEDGGKVEVHDLVDQEPVWEHDLGSDGLHPADTDLTWVGFASDGVSLGFGTADGDGETLHRANFTNGGDPEEVRSARWEPEGGAADWAWNHDFRAGERYNHEHEGVDGEIIEVEGVHSGEEPMPTYVRIWPDGEMIGPNEGYEDFAPTPDGTYIGASIDRTEGSDTAEPDVGHLVELTFDDEGEVSEWSEITEADGIDAFALSPDHEQIAVSRDGEVFLLPVDGSADETRLDEDGSQDYRVLGWF